MKPDPSLNIEVQKLSNTWDTFGSVDPMWAICSDASKLGRWWNEEDFFKSGEIEIDRTIEVLGSLGAAMPFDKALDFGCGIGRLTRSLAKYSREVVGIDIAESMIERAKVVNQHHLAHASWVLNTSPDLSVFPSESFSLTYTNIVLQHMRPALARSYIEEFFRITRPGGWVVFQLPDSDTLTYMRRLHNFAQNEIVPHLPEGVKQALRRWRYPNADQATLRNLPFAQMFGIGKREMVAFLTRLGGTVRFTEIGDDADYGWDSVRYYVQKRAS